MTVAADSNYKKNAEVGCVHATQPTFILLGVFKLIKEAFKYVAAMLLSLLLFSLVMSKPAKQLVWNSVEPSFQSTWRDATFDDGRRYKQAIDAEFSSMSEVRSFP